MTNHIPLLTSALTKKRKKAVSPTFIPRKAAKKKKKAKPKTKNETNEKVAKNNIRLVSPTLQGVTKAAAMIESGKRLALPTETVYFNCTTLKTAVVTATMSTTTRTTKDTTDPPPPPLLLVHHMNQLRYLLPLKKRRYAIDPRKHVVRFNESWTLLNLFVQRGVWQPGPLRVYVKLTEEDASTLPTTPCGCIGILFPSHPLARKFLELCPSPVVGIPTRAKTAASFLVADDDEPTDGGGGGRVVLNGEGNAEAWSVPTCQLPPNDCSLWVNQDERTITIKSNDGIICAEQKQKLQSLLSAGTSTCSRVVRAVLSKWKIETEIETP